MRLRDQCRLSPSPPPSFPIPLKHNRHRRDPTFPFRRLFFALFSLAAVPAEAAFFHPFSKLLRRRPVPVVLDVSLRSPRDTVSFYPIRYSDSDEPFNEFKTVEDDFDVSSRNERPSIRRTGGRVRRSRNPSSSRSDHDGDEKGKSLPALIPLLLILTCLYNILGFGGGGVVYYSSYSSSTIYTVDGRREVKTERRVETNVPRLMKDGDEKQLETRSFLGEDSKEQSTVGPFFLIKARFLGV
uniref:Transmembrane protein n=1 Tax=Corethron hystrix TaxID=216773 RepID=A0A7S1FY14_9STRA|mmetsp:Transcript_37269/g.86934  ORF Transcript_37269/g.86934 Transcript_37269/m.86934 type:complete len:241 (+) Transcript_37269:98-820(+)